MGSLEGINETDFHRGVIRAPRLWEEAGKKGPAAGCHVWDRRVTDLSFHTLIKSHPGVLDAFQSPGALGKAKQEAAIT